MNPRDDTLKVGKAFSQFTKVGFERRMVNQILYGVLSESFLSEHVLRLAIAHEPFPDLLNVPQWHAEPLSKQSLAYSGQVYYI
jgi:hypothetical protein